METLLVKFLQVLEAIHFMLSPLEEEIISQYDCHIDWTLKI